LTLVRRVSSARRNAASPPQRNEGNAECEATAARGHPAISCKHAYASTLRIATRGAVYHGSARLRPRPRSRPGARRRAGPGARPPARPRALLGCIAAAGCCSLPCRRRARRFRPRRRGLAALPATLSRRGLRGPLPAPRAALFPAARRLVLGRPGAPGSFLPGDALLLVALLDVAGSPPLLGRICRFLSACHLGLRVWVPGNVVPAVPACGEGGHMGERWVERAQMRPFPRDD
jgi:hypothetical protein